MIPVFAWYAYTLPGMQNNAVPGGIFNSIAEGDPIMYAITGNLFDMLPTLYLGYISLPFFLLGLFVLFRNRKQIFTSYLPYTLSCILLILYFVYESNLISTVHVYYMMPFLIPLFLICASGLDFMLQQKWTTWLAIAPVLSAPHLATEMSQPKWNPGVTEYCHDLFQYRDELRAAVPDTALVVMGNDLTMNVMPYYIDKKGWTYVDAELQRTHLESYMQAGATYLYTNSAMTLADTSIRKLRKREVGVFGIIHIFERGAENHQY